MAEQFPQSAPKPRKMRLFSSLQPHPTRAEQTVETFHIHFQPPCETTSEKTFIPKTKDRPTGYMLVRAEQNRVEEVILERSTIGWSSDREAALIKFARDLGREHNYPLDPSITPLPQGASTASSVLAAESNAQAA